MYLLSGSYMIEIFLFNIWTACYVPDIILVSGYSSEQEATLPYAILKKYFTVSIFIYVCMCIYTSIYICSWERI